MIGNFQQSVNASRPASRAKPYHRRCCHYAHHVLVWVCFRCIVYCGEIKKDSFYSRTWSGCVFFRNTLWMTLDRYFVVFESQTSLLEEP